MNINECHVNSGVQTWDEAFGVIFKMIRQCITALRQNVSLRQRHLSNQYLKLQNTYSCVITIWMWYDEHFSMRKAKRTPSKTLIGTHSIEKWRHNLTFKYHCDKHIFNSKIGYRTICHLIKVNINAFITKIIKFSIVLYRILFVAKSVSNRRFYSPWVYM